jgi:hypothetical protein
VKPLFADTDPAAERVLIEGYRRMTPAERLARAMDLIQAAQLLVEADVRRRHPDASEREVALRVAFRRIPPDLMRSAFGWDPDVEGY